MINEFYKYLTSASLDDSNRNVIESLLNGMYYLNYADPFKAYNAELQVLINKFNIDVPNDHVKNVIGIHKKIIVQWNTLKMEV